MNRQALQYRPRKCSSHSEKARPLSRECGGSGCSCCSLEKVCPAWGPWARIGDTAAMASASPFLPRAPAPGPRPRTREESTGCFCCRLILFLLQPSSLTSRNQGAKNSESRCYPACQLGPGFRRNGGCCAPVIPVLTSCFPRSPEKQGQVLEDSLGRIQKTLEKPRGVS